MFLLFFLVPDNNTLTGMGGYGVWHSAQDILDIFNQDEVIT
jgi:hypothetical protein